MISTDASRLDDFFGFAHKYVILDVYLLSVVNRSPSLWSSPVQVLPDDL